MEHAKLYIGKEVLWDVNSDVDYPDTLTRDYPCDKDGLVPCIVDAFEREGYRATTSDVCVKFMRLNGEEAFCWTGRKWLHEHYISPKDKLSKLLVEQHGLTLRS